MATISIIMGIYNCSKTLEDAINSILNQTYEDWKLIMCDDASSDDTYLIAEEYAKKNNNIILIKNEKNMGLNYTLNKCLELVDTEYVARMDGDDLCDPKRFEKEINFLLKHPEYSIVSTNMYYFDENGVWGISKAIEKPVKKDLIKGTPFCDVYPVFWTR